jgi:hypothetical protein
VSSSHLLTSSSSPQQQILRRLSSRSIRPSRKRSYLLFPSTLYLYAAPRLRSDAQTELASLLGQLLRAVAVDVGHDLILIRLERNLARRQMLYTRPINRQHASEPRKEVNAPETKDVPA